MKKKLRIISLIMLMVAIVFVVVAFAAMGSTLTIPFDADILYRGYIIVMIFLFVVSFFIKEKK